MTAEQVFKYYRVYRLYFSGNYDITKFKGNLKNIGPLIQQPERRFYYRLAQKLTDAQIHSLFTYQFFCNPRAYITNIATQEAMQKAIAHASRAENGRPLLEADLYELRKHLKDENVDEWLYGEVLGSQRAHVPGCLQDLAAGRLALDVACMLLLIPQPDLHYHWTEHRKKMPVNLAFGPLAVTERLQKVDKLFWMHRTGWRTLSHELAKTFWLELCEQNGLTTLAPMKVESEAGLF